MCKFMWLNRALFISYSHYKGFRQQSDLQTHSRSLAIIPFNSSYMIFYLSSIVTVSLSCTVSEILSLIFENLNISWSFKGQFVIPMLNCHLANHSTKFEVSSFSHSGDIVGGLRIGDVTITTPLLGVIFYTFGKTQYGPYVLQNLTALASDIPEILMGPSKFKMGHVT